MNRRPIQLGYGRPATGVSAKRILGITGSIISGVAGALFTGVGFVMLLTAAYHSGDTGSRAWFAMWVCVGLAVLCFLAMIGLGAVGKPRDVPPA